MLRLWPETHHVGLFPERSWLAHGSGRRRRLVELDAGSAEATMAERLGRVLAQAADVRPGGRLRIVVSDTLATVAAIPWSAELTSLGERIAFAHACLDRAGLPAGGEWCTHVEFRHFGAMGIAYGLRQLDLDAVLACASSYRLGVAGVMPVSALAQLAARRTSAAATAWTLLAESGRISALVVDRWGLRTLDVEPVIGSAEQAMARLVTRLRAAAAAPAAVRLWSTSGDASTLAGALARTAPPDGVQSLPLHHWEAWQ